MLFRTLGPIRLHYQSLGIELGHISSGPLIRYWRRFIDETSRIVRNGGVEEHRRSLAAADRGLSRVPV